MSQLLKVTLLGAPTITLAERPLTGLLTGKALALFAYLAVNRQPHARDHLADLLWSECNNQQARNNLRYLLPDLRRPLECYLIITPQTIGFNQQAPYWLDVEVLQRTLATQMTALNQGNVGAINLPLFQKALDLYQGKFLAGFTVRKAPVFEAWVAHQESQLHNLALQGCYSLAEAYFQQGQIQAGLTTNQRLLQWEPWHEAGHRLHMRLLVAAGQRSAALAQYDLCRQLLAAELGVAPEPATTALFEAIRSDAYGSNRETGRQEDRETGKREDKKTRRQEDKKTGRHGALLAVPSDQVTSLPAAGAHGVRAITLTSANSVEPSSPHPDFGERSRVVTPSPSHNLPGQLTPFVGRTAEIDELCALLADPTRPLITLAGLGGIGKTRLALAVAQRILDFRSFQASFAVLDSSVSAIPLADNQKLVTASASLEGSKIQNLKFLDGIWFVPLIGITDGENLADRLAVAIMDALQLPRTGPLAPVEQLLDTLHDRSLLLILDNFEHLLTGAEFLYALLQRTQQVKVLVTSRQTLNLQAEFVWQVAGLTMPEDQTPFLKPVEALQYDSVALFVARAQYADYTFRLDEHNQADILRICRFVEGLPLGIELAAAMLRYYNCRELWQLLHQNYSALAVTQRDLAPRHRSITALFDHSWVLLTPAQASALAACSIFPQAFTLDAAAFIADATAEILFALIDHSLLRQTDGGRFELHELVRQYAADQLQRQAQEVAHRRQRHVDYYSTLIEADPEALMRRPEKLQLVRQELANIRMAAWWCMEQQQLLPIIRLSEGVFLHAMEQGPLEDGWHLCNAVVELLRRWPTAPQNLAEAHFFALAPAGLAYLGYYLGRYGEVLSLAEEAIARAQPIMAQRALAMAYSIKGMVLFGRGDFEAHEALCRTALAHAHAEPIQHMIAVNWAFLGFGLAVQGKLTEARVGLEEALQLVQEMQLVYLEGFILSELGFIYAMTGDWALAEETTQQALTTGQQLQNSLNRGYQYERLAFYAETLGDYARAITHTDQALSFADNFQDSTNRLGTLLVRGRALRHLTDLSGAEAALQQALGLAQQLKRPVEIAKSHIELGHIALARQLWQQAEAQYQAGLTLALARDLPCRAAAQSGLAHLALHQNQPGVALMWVERTLPTLFSQALDGEYDVANAAHRCYQVLAATQDERAAPLLQQICTWLEAQALKISDETLRHSFLTKVPVHHELLALARRSCGESVESRVDQP